MNHHYPPQPHHHHIGAGTTVLVVVAWIAAMAIWTEPLAHWPSLIAHTACTFASWLIGVAVIASGAVGVVVCRGRVRSAVWARWYGWWHYRRRWDTIMCLHRLITLHGERVLVPRLRTITVGTHTDVLLVVMLPGQDPDDWEHQRDALAHAFGADEARIRVQAPSLLTIGLRYDDTLAEPIRLPLPAPVPVDRRAA